MSDYSTQAKALQNVIYTAWKAGFVAEVLAALTDLAALMNTHGRTADAAAAVAFVMHYPDVPYDTFDRAEDVWIDLETHVCPRVLEDAKMWAAVQTLRGAVEAALDAGGDTPPPPLDEGEPEA